MSNTQSLPEPGSRHTVTIHDVAFGGDGVARIGDIAVFVPFVCAGETVEVEIVSTHKRFARAKLITLIQPDAARVTPPCPVYGQCAGCQYQHMTYAAQLQVKEKQVRDLFARIGRWPDAPVMPVIGAQAPWQYRTRITLHGPGAPAYIGVDQHTRVPIIECPIARPEVNAELAEWRTAHSEGLRKDEDLLLSAYASDSIEIHGVSFECPPQSFFQVNEEMASRLVEHVLSGVRASKARILIDAYAGVGVFGLLAAPEMERVGCIEWDAAAVKAARRNAKRLARQNVECVTGKVEDHMAAMLARLRPNRDEAVVCVLDPPRSGCAPAVLSALVDASVDHIVYVSCAPDRLARDARYLLDHGYKCDAIQPFDMFPQTAHVEVVAVFNVAAGVAGKNSVPR